MEGYWDFLLYLSREKKDNWKNKLLSFDAKLTLI
jgi:hypothetical protein